MSRKKDKVKKIIVLSTKGGSGKSTISHYILPFYFINEDSKIDYKKEKVNLTIFELEATNTSREDSYAESCVKYIYDKMDDSEKTQDIFLNTIFDENSGAIFDVGSGRDALLAIQNISTVSDGLDNFVFLFPFNLTVDSFNGAYEMYAKVREEHKDVKCLFVLNRITYRYDDSDKPRKMFLDNNDIEKEMSKVNLDFEKVYKDNIPITYIPEMMEILPSVLFSIEGCCIDYCSDLLNGISASDLRKEAMKKAKSMEKSLDKQKEEYKVAVHDILRKRDLHRMMLYSRPFYDTIDVAIAPKKKS